MKAVRKTIVALLIMAFALSLTGCSVIDYGKAAKLMKSGDYTAASEMFKALGDYKDSAEQASACDYQLADAAFETGDHDTARELFAGISGYKDSAARADEAGDLAILKKLTGSWVAKDVDISGQFIDAFSSWLVSSGSDDLAACFDFSALAVNYNLEFTEKVTFVLSVDQDSFNDVIDDVFVSLNAGMLKYAEAIYTQLAEENGMTLEALMSYYGVSTTEELFAVDMGMDVDSYLSSILSRDSLMSMAEDLATNGTFSVDSGVISMTIGKETEAAAYDAAADTVTVKDAELSDEGSLVFERAASKGSSNSKA